MQQHAVEEPGEFGGHRLGRHRSPQPSPKSADCAPRQVSLARKVVAAILRRAVVGGRATFPSDSAPTGFVVWSQLELGNKMVLGLPLAHIPSYFADNRHRHRYID